MELCDRVRARRLELHMTQDELAKKMGYSSRVSINKIEMGRPVSQKIITKLAEALEVTPSWLMGWTSESTISAAISTEQVTESEKLLLDLFRFIPEEEQQMVLNMIRAALGSKGLL